MDKKTINQDSMRAAQTKRGVEDELEWVRKRIKLAVDGNARKEEQAKYRAAGEIGKEVQNSMDSIKRLSDLNKTREENIKKENEDISRLSEEAQAKEKSLTQIGLQIKELEQVQQETFRSLETVQNNTKNSKKAIVKFSKEIAKWKEQKE